KSYSKDSRNNKGQDKNRSSDDDDSEHGTHYGDYDHDHKGQSKEMEAWALGEKFPGQIFAGFFIYSLESCDPVEKSIIQFSDAVYTVKEEGPVAVITVVRTGNLDLAASVEYTTMDGSAVNGADYVFASGVLNFAPGQSSAQFEVTPIDDSEIEPVESLTMKLSNPLGANLGQQKMATLEIEDNDQVTAAVIAIDRIIPNPVEESNTVTIYVTRTGDINVDATVDYGTLDGTAIGATQCGAPATPVPFDYEQVGGTLFFDAGVTELTIEVTTCNNNPRGDTTETFDIEIYNPVGAELIDDGDGNPFSNIETITILEAS
ncbi:MAG: Calx-beta domain-containing protein, partial [Gammaproteobacteria bacterium]